MPCYCFRTPRYIIVNITTPRGRLQIFFEVNFLKMQEPTYIVYSAPLCKGRMSLDKIRPFQRHNVRLSRARAELVLVIYSRQDSEYVCNVNVARQGKQLEAIFSAAPKHLLSGKMKYFFTISLLDGKQTPPNGKLKTSFFENKCPAEGLTNVCLFFPFVENSHKLQIALVLFWPGQGE